MLHALDVLAFILGEFDSVRALSAVRRWRREWERKLQANPDSRF